jgi:hypothetical protein
MRTYNMMLFFGVGIAAGCDVSPTQVLQSPPTGNVGYEVLEVPVIAGRNVTDQVVGQELVLGVVVNGEARAYPINMLTGGNREIINDVVGGRAIAATW